MEDPQAAEVVATLESLTDGFWKLDPGWRLTYVNPEGARSVGRSQAELSHRLLWEAFPSIRGTRLEDEIRRAAAQRVTVELEHLDARSRRWFGLKVFPTPDGGTAVLSRDITNRKRVEDALRESENRLRIATRAGKLGVFEWDLGKDEAVWENEQMYTIFGHTHEDGAVNGQRFFDAYLHPDDREPVVEAVQAAQRPGAQLHATCRIYPKNDERVRWVELAGEFARNESGALQRLVGVLTDVTERKLDEERLRGAHDAFRDLVQNSPFGVYAVDADFRLVQVSRGAQKVFENVRPLLGRDFAEVLRIVWPEPFATEAAGRFRHTLETGEPYHAPGTVERRNDIEEVEAYDWKIERVPLPDGRFGVVCHFYDFSERQRYEQALRDREAELRRSEERFRQLADAMPQLVWTATNDGVVTYSNSQRDRYQGDPPGADGRWGWHAPLHPDDLAPTLRAWDRALEDGGGVYQFEHRMRMADGSYRWHLSRAHRARSVDGDLWFGTATDIHDLKEAQMRIRESEQRFKRMADTAPAMLWMSDQRNQTTFLSRGWSDFTGLSSDESMGSRWEQAIHPGDRERARDVFFTAAERHDTFEVDYRLQNAQGEYRWVVVAGRPRFEASGRFLGYIGSIIDVHERKIAEHELKRLNDELSEANRRKDEFLAMLGHELRNPLAAIRNATQLMKVAAPEDARLRRSYDVLERQSLHMARLIDGLLEVSRIARGKIYLERVVLDLRHLLARVVQDRCGPLEDRGLRIEAALPSTPVWLDADPVRLTQIFDNLLGNAIKFTEPPGSIRVSLEIIPEAAVVRVRDTGVGIRAEMLERLFEPFQQDTQDLARATGGLGLGLALAKGLVELHGGTIAARSAGPGAGAEFEIRLPLAAASPPEHPPRPQRDAFGASTVLIVEDNPDAGRTLQDLLEILGHEVVLARTGAQALDLLQTARPDLVLCDLGLPDMTGYDVARRIRDSPSLRTLPLVAVTGYGQPEDRRRSKEAGFDAHLTKPVELEILSGVVGSLTAARRNPTAAP